MTQKEHKQRYKPWITGGMLTSMMQHDRLLEKYIRLKDPIRKNTIILNIKYIRLKDPIRKNTIHLEYKIYQTEGSNQEEYNTS